MTDFCPTLGTQLTIELDTYEFLPHPHPTLFGDVHKIVRNQATTYQLRNRRDQTLWALKVTNVGYRGPHIARATNILIHYLKQPGLLVGHRNCLTKTTHPELIATYPALEYAVLMPWVTGQSWTGFMADPVASANYTRSQALELALTTAHVLWNLEAHHLTHTDIAGDNVMVLNFKRVELIDIEGLYIHGTPLSAQPSRGWRGYQHPRLDQRGNCRPEGDRFAGAILLTEMLTWWRSLIRATTPNTYDSLFQSWDQEPRTALEDRLKVIRSTLWRIHPCLRDLFDQAWYSSDLAQCPDLGAWTMYLLQAQR